MLVVSCSHHPVCNLFVDVAGELLSCHLDVVNIGPTTLATISVPQQPDCVIPNLARAANGSCIISFVADQADFDAAPQPEMQRTLAVSAQSADGASDYSTSVKLSLPLTPQPAVVLNSTTSTNRTAGCCYRSPQPGNSNYVMCSCPSYIPEQIERMRMGYSAAPGKRRVHVVRRLTLPCCQLF